MKAKYISYQDTHAFSKLVLDYVNDNEALKNLYCERPDLNGFKNAIENHQFLGNRQVLNSVLKDQYQSIQLHDSVRTNIELLLHPKTYTVTTGHQLNLFTGPLYFIYKIVSTINLALELKIKYPDKNFVPIYWMATEDHDFNEINHVKVDDKNISWIEQTNGATGRINTKNVAAAVTAYQGYLGISKNGKKLGKLIQKAYLDHSNLADATRFLVNALFDQYGLVIINADNAQLKQLFAPIIEQDILEQYSNQNIAQTNAYLEQHNYSIQIHSRDINFFYLQDTLRERIIKSENGFKVNNTEITFTKEELIQEIKQHPERFSPNVVMRPLYQEYILPNIAYIGGGAEVSYWLQLKTNFDFYKVNYPVLLLRNSALVIDRRSADDLKSLGFTYEDLFLSVQQLQNSWIDKNTKEDLSLKRKKDQFKEIFNQVSAQATKIDKTLIASVESASKRTEKLILHLEKKFLRAEKRKYKEAIQKIENLQKRLFPGGTLQERVLNLAPMFVNYGDDFIASLVENFEPLGGDFTILLPGTHDRK